MTTFAEIQIQHEALLERLDSSRGKTELLPDVQRYLEDLEQASATIQPSEHRDQLRAILRFWGAFVYEQTGTYPANTIRPFTSSLVSFDKIGVQESNAVLVEDGRKKELTTDFRRFSRREIIILCSFAALVLVLWIILFLLLISG
jgi:hypothetical protein